MGGVRCGTDFMLVGDPDISSPNETGQIEVKTQVWEFAGGSPPKKWLTLHSYAYVAFNKYPTTPHSNYLGR